MNKKQTVSERRERVRMKYGGRCAYCGEQLKDGWHIDHMKPLKRWHEFSSSVRNGRGGFVVAGVGHPERDTMENKMPACASCNINKHSMDVEEFRRTIAGYVRSLNERFTQYKMAKRFGLIVETDKPVRFFFETWLDNERFYAEPLHGIDKVNAGQDATDEPRTD